MPFQIHDERHPNNTVKTFTVPTVEVAEDQIAFGSFCLRAISLCVQNDRVPLNLPLSTHLEIGPYTGNLRQSHSRRYPYY